jgi:beta-glucosidase-like glycosyl hydrolase
MDIARQFGMYIIPAPATKLSNALEIPTNSSDTAAELRRLITLKKQLYSIPSATQSEPQAYFHVQDHLSAMIAIARHSISVLQNAAGRTAFRYRRLTWTNAS